MNREMHAAAVMFGNEDGEVLVLHRRADMRDGGVWGLVGGVVEGEDVESELVAKVKAEIGVAVGVTALELLRRYHWQRDEEWSLTFDVYGALINKAEFEVDLNLDGHDRYAWMPPSELAQRTDLIHGLRQVVEDHYLLPSGVQQP